MLATTSYLLSRTTHNSVLLLERDAFPRKIWQTWREPAQALRGEFLEWARTWTTYNAGYRYELLRDDAALTFVQDKYKDRPDIVRTYERIEDSILRADLFRYLVLLAEGGVYADIDVECIRPIKQWVPAKHVRASSLVVGVEYDALGEAVRADFTIPLQLCQWTLFAKPGSRALQHVVNRVIAKLDELVRKGRSITAHGLDDVLELTGPLMMTTAILEYMSIQIGREVTHADLSNLTQPKAIADVLILPVSAFRSRANHSGSKPYGNIEQLVDHHFYGEREHGWKQAHMPESGLQRATRKLLKNLEAGKNHED